MVLLFNEDIKTAAIVEQRDAYTESPERSALIVE